VIGLKKLKLGKKHVIARAILTTFLLSLFVLNGCNNASELEETISYQEERIAELEQELEEAISNQEERIAELEQELEEQVELNAGLLVELEEDIPENGRPEFSQGLINDLMENIEDLAVPFLGYSPEVSMRPAIRDDDTISIHFDRGFGISGQVTTHVSTGRFSPIVILSFQVDIGEDDERRVSTWTWADWEGVDIVWEVIGYNLGGEWRSADEREPRHLTDLETVTIRIYEFSDGCYESQGWDYHEEIIQGSSLWEETLRLMPEVWDLWYEESILYVDLMPSESVDVGGQSGVLRGYRFAYIFSSFPHVSEIRFSTIGEPGFMMIGSMAGYRSGVFNVEDRRWVQPCELEVDDPWKSERHLQYLQSECE